ncbi:MAG: hypothetical protein HY453_00470 [Parcubacteria group bacterium]|nr:hypothetical protein [Parcubacteria group bacterium]
MHDDEKYIPPDAEKFQSSGSDDPFAKIQENLEKLKALGAFKELDALKKEFITARPSEQEKKRYHEKILDMLGKKNMKNAMFEGTFGWTVTSNEDGMVSLLKGKEKRQGITHHEIAKANIPYKTLEEWSIDLDRSFLKEGESLDANRMEMGKMVLEPRYFEKYKDHLFTGDTMRKLLFYRFSSHNNKYVEQPGLPIRSQQIKGKGAREQRAYQDFIAWESQFHPEEQPQEAPDEKM